MSEIPNHAQDVRRFANDAARRGGHAADVALVREVLAGDPAAWTRFVERYAGLIYAMVRRYLRSGDTDDIRTVFVDVLVSLRRSKLRTYEGRASLSTWLTLVSRTGALDHLRREFGRGREARGLARLTPAERTLFRLYHIEGRSPHDVVAELAKRGEVWGFERFIAALRSIEHRLGDSWLRRLAYDMHAQSIGAASGRLLEYLDHVRDEFQQSAGAYSPEYHMMEREARRSVEQLTLAVAALDSGERRMLQLRFERGWTAREIAKELGLESPRAVYGMIERLVRKLRHALGHDDGAAS